MDYKEKIERQILRNSQLNLLYKDLSPKENSDDQFKNFLINVKEKNFLNEEMIRFVENRTIKAICNINQYLLITPQDRENLRQIYRETWEEIDPENVEKVLVNHYRRLSDWIEKIYPPKFVSALRELPQIGKVENSFYSPEFQLAILGIDPEEIIGPVLDIGCGEKGLLVDYFWTKGFFAEGIDRIVDGENPRLLEKDWFDPDFLSEGKLWGTIISHLAFSNHCIYCLNNQKERVESFLMIFNKILKSLAPGGSFIYTPGVKILEDLIDPDKFCLTTHFIREGFYSTEITKKRK